MLFYGPGNGEAGIDWEAFQIQHRSQQALTAGVPESSVRDFLIIPLGDRGRLNFTGLTRAYAERQVKRRARAYAAVLSLQYGIPFITKQAAFLRYQSAYAALDVGVSVGARRIATREAAEAAMFRVLMRKAPVRIVSRVVPYVGWGLAAWDIFTITTRGELWGVQIYEKA